MAYDEGVAQRVREVLADEEGLDEKRMFGGVGFLLHGNMACGVLGDGVVVRVGPDGYARALEEGARVFDFTGRAMKGWVVVGAALHEDDDALAAWVARGVAFARSLPPK